MKNRQEIASLLSSVLPVARSEQEVFESIELPKDRKLGDWAFPCFTLSKELRKAPPQIANELAGLVAPKLPEYPSLSKVAATGPYLNFFVNKSALAAELIPQILSGTFTARREQKPGKLMIEYSQPNTHKAFHVGHVRCAALGDILIRISEWLGNEVIATNYLGDEGTHVAKCLWYFTEVFKGKVPEKNRGEFLGNLYTTANDLVDLSTMTRAPFPGVVAAKVIALEQHPTESSWIVAKLDTGSAVHQVVTGVKGFNVGDILALALPGAAVTDRAIAVADRKGVKSEGMVCSEQELDLSDVKDKVLVLPKDTALGTEIAELYKIADKVPAGASVLETLKARQKAISTVLQKMESKEPEMHRIWKETKEWSMQELYQCYRWLDCRFDHYFFESEFGESGKEIVREYQKRGVFIESQGAVGADLGSFGLGFCLLIKRDGTAMYACRDLALARKKFEEFGIDSSLYVVDSAQTLHFNQVFKCLELMGFPQAKNCRHLAYAQVVRPDGKMSSRKGNVILFSQLQERLLSKINSEFLDKYRGEWSEEEIATAAHRLALATMRYGMMNVDNSSQVVFDLDEWTARTGNTGPYLMYACARIHSILRDAGEVSATGVDWSVLSHESEVDLILQLNRYHQIVSDVGTNCSPHLLCAYLYDLSKRFSTMYAVCSVLNAESAALKQARTCLVKSVLTVLEHGLGLLGIKTVERM